MEVKTIFVKTDKRIPCLIYEPPEKSEKSEIAVILMHSDDDYSDFIPAPELSKRGYPVFTAHFPNASVTLDEKLEGLHSVVKLAKGQPGIKKILLLGHSGGATLMTAYQAAAEKGLSLFRKDSLLIPLKEMEELTPADAVMLLDANFGNGVMSLLSLDPAVTDETSGLKRDPSLDMLNPENYTRDEEGHISFKEAFLKKALKAQADRMNRLIAFAQDRLTLIEGGKGYYADDEPMVIPGGAQVAFCNKYFPQMTRYFSHTSERRQLLHADGSLTKEIVPCLREARGMMDATSRLHGGGRMTTVKTFLSSMAVRALPDYHFDETTLYGVDWQSSYCVTVGNAGYIRVPMLLMGMTGSYEYIAAEHVFRMAENCPDKEIAFVEGAGHNFTPIPGQKSCVKACFDFVDRWIERKMI